MKSVAAMSLAAGSGDVNDAASVLVTSLLVSDVGLTDLNWTRF
jgi:hypothetical protein